MPSAPPWSFSFETPQLLIPLVLSVDFLCLVEDTTPQNLSFPEKQELDTFVWLAGSPSLASVTAWEQRLRGMGGAVCCIAFFVGLSLI
jgi:hypothetical protein